MMIEVLKSYLPILQFFNFHGQINENFILCTQNQKSSNIPINNLENQMIFNLNFFLFNNNKIENGIHFWIQQTIITLSNNKR